MEQIIEFLGLSNEFYEKVKFLHKSYNDIVSGPETVVVEAKSKYIALNKENMFNAYRIMWTSINGSIAEFSESSPKVYA